MEENLEGGVCCMCGDVGFPDKLFRCHNCRHRIQHSYCSNYYGGLADPIHLCDWCRSDDARSPTHGGRALPSKTIKHSSPLPDAAAAGRSEYGGGDKVKIHDHPNPDEIRGGGGGGGDQGGNSNNNRGKSGSPRTTTRRYKLLKDVMC